jgi:hypothetical protein
MMAGCNSGGKRLVVTGSPSPGFRPERVNAPVNTLSNQIQINWVTESLEHDACQLRLTDLTRYVPDISTDFNPSPDLGYASK